MTIDTIRFAPPDDLDFHMLLLKASRDQVPVYGVVIETEKVTLKRSFDSHRPETMPSGEQIIQTMMKDWQDGQTVQPWLYVKHDHYIVPDDYFWLALIEQGRPTSFAAQVLGEPIAAGLVQKVGPLGAGYIHERFGKL